ncbi:hypothetical protein VTK73DRAFT_1899 [Phialemonium thermophilum]|uniref:Uncharacterized protein n=1 Tax=Phialemonium thermophilum TaxID=223376 RepID=A0ABR3Y229_9PEZI
MLGTLVRRSAERATRRLEIPYNPYKTKKVWPPDFSKLSPQEQLRFEKRFKRRVQLATARPRWNKMIKLIQLFSTTSIVVYCVLFMDWKTDHQPFQEIRDKFWSLFGNESDEDRRYRVPEPYPLKSPSTSPKF